jgi:hypothetical protein
MPSLTTLREEPIEVVQTPVPKVSPNWTNRRTLSRQSICQGKAYSTIVLLLTS